jgi:hypothetical protein
MIIKPYSEDLYSYWDAFIDSSDNGVFFHKRRFISYHGNRFVDMSLVIENEKGKIIGLFPAAIDPDNDSIIASHPGISFGGLISGDKCKGETCIHALKKIGKFYKKGGFNSLLYKAIPYIFHTKPNQDDLYALFRLKAHKYRSDISATINIHNRGKVTKGRKYDINKGKRMGVVIHNDIQYVEELWRILENNLLTKHQVKPTHSLDEILLLHSRFEKEIIFLSASIDSQIVAGLVLFSMGSVLHTQYISATDTAYETGALDFLIESAIALAKEKNYKYFNFGISNEKEGRILNEGLYRFKRSFGAGSIVYEYFKLDLLKV